VPQTNCVLSHSRLQLAAKTAEFQTRGPMAANDLSPSCVSVCGTTHVKECICHLYLYKK